MDSILQLRATQTSQYPAAPLARLPCFIQQKEKSSKLCTSTQRHEGWTKCLSDGGHYCFCRSLAWLNADFSLRKFVCNCTGPGLQEGADSRRPGHWPHISLLKRIKILLPRTVRPVQLVCTELFAGCLAIIQCQLTGMPSLARVVRCVATQIIITSAIMINSLRQQL